MTQDEVISKEAVRDQGIKLGEIIIGNLRALSSRFSETLVLQRLGNTLTTFNHLLYEIQLERERYLVSLAGLCHPKWLHFYRNGKRAKTRRKYLKKLIRAGQAII